MGFCLKNLLSRLKQFTFVLDTAEEFVDKIFGVILQENLELLIADRFQFLLIAILLGDQRHHILQTINN